MKNIHQWFEEYGESHKNETNKLIHWICVPTIFLSVVIILNQVKFSDVSLAQFIFILVALFYWRLSKPIFIGITLFYLTCLIISYLVEQYFNSPIVLAVIMFVIAWIGQFYGHKIEGKKPSFLKDLQFLLIGPAWLLSFIYSRAGIKF